MGWLKWISGTAGGSPRVKATAQDKAILDVKLQRDKIRQYQKRLRQAVDFDRLKAIELLQTKQRDRALLLLRRKKHNESLLKQTDEQLITLEDLSSHIEQAVLRNQVVASLDRGNEVLKALNKEASIDKVERILEESAEGQAYQAEVSAMLSERISEADEQDVQDELDALIAENERTVPKLPSAPTDIRAPVEPQLEEETKEAEQRTAMLA